MPNTVIYANVLPFIASLFMLFFVWINPLFDKKQNKMFFLSSSTILFMLIVISVDYTVSLGTFEYAWIIRRITSFLHFSISCIVPVFLISIFLHKNMRRILYLPAAINLVVCAMSMFFNLVFYFPKDGGYDRGPLFLLPVATTLFYIILLLAASIRERKKRAYEAMFLIGVIAGFMLSMYLEVVEHFKFLSWDFAASFLILYYLLLNINKSKIDPLTGANNRAMYIQKTGALNRARCCTIAMIDINDFKTVNDEKGHEEGDRLLIHFVKTVEVFMDRKNVLYRIGGDEFAVISEDVSIKNLKKRMEAVFIKLGESNIYCAVGFEEYDPAVDIESAIRSADMKMYENKRQYYAKKAR